MNLPLHSKEAGIALPSGLSSAAASLRKGIGTLSEDAVLGVSRRQDRLWLALVAIPLALVAAVLSFQFWLLPPLIVLDWWWASKEWAWTWLAGIIEACWGIQWAFLGTTFLAAYPAQRLVVGGLWIAYAGLVIVLCTVNRRLGSPTGV